MKKYLIPLCPNTYVYFSHNLDELCKKFYVTGDKECFGHTWHYVDKNTKKSLFVVWVNKNKHKTKQEYIITVAHECHHLAYYVLEAIGESRQAEEIACRLQDYFMEKILN